MTTDLITATTTDDLLAFLRSDSPPPKRATTQRAAIRTTTPTAERRPLTPIEAATMRRPPLASDRYRAATREAYAATKDYSEHRQRDEVANTLRRVECRLVAWLVCRSLGVAWRFESADDGHCCHRFVHRASCATLSFRRCWRDEGRYEIVPENIHRTDSMPRSITVSGERCPADIASDVSRRLIGAGLLDQNAALLSAGHQRRLDEVKRRRECLAVARAYGGNLHPERRWKSTGYPAATSETFGPAIDAGYNRRETEIAASVGYNGLEISVETSSVQLAIKIAELVRGHYN